MKSKNEQIIVVRDHLLIRSETDEKLSAGLFYLLLSL